MSRSGATAVLRDSNLLDFLEERPPDGPVGSVGSIPVMNSTSSIKSSSSSDQQDSGIRLAQEFSEHLTAVHADERKRLVASFLDMVDDETLAILSSRSESEKKSRKKGKDSSKSKKCNQNNRENGHTASAGSSSMEVISEASHNQQQVQSQTSPSAASRKTFAGFLRSKRDRAKTNKGSKKDKNAAAKADALNETSVGADSGCRDSNADVRVDDEGYVIREPLPFDQRKDADNFYSDSDSSDDEESKKPIHVIIKPINGTNALKNSGSIAELKQTVKSLSISPSLTTSKHDTKIMRSKRRHVMSDYESGPLKRSFSQHLYRGDHSAFPPNSVSDVSIPDPTNFIANNHQFHKQTSSGFFGNSSGSAPNSASATAPPEDRYAALSSLFAEAASNGTTDSAFASSPSHVSQSTSCSNLSKSMSSSSVMGPPLPVIPKPPSKQVTGRQSVALTGFTSTPLASDANQFSAFSTSSSVASAFQNNMQRCKSYGSLTSSEMRMTPISLNSVGSSRGPSPLTIGFNDTVPLAVALQESISARFKGSDESRCEVQMMGSLKIAFPAGIVQALTSNPSPSVLSFRISNCSRIDRLVPNQIILSWSGSMTAGQSEYSFDIKPNGLVNSLKRSLEQTPNARYYYLDVLKYQLKSSPGADSCPLQVVSHWKCEPNSTGLKIDYKYNPSALSSLEPLRNVSFSVSIDGNVIEVQGKPQPVWNSLTRQACWSFPVMSLTSDESGLGSLRAKFDVMNGPSKPTPVSVQFSCSDSTLSGIEFELLSPGYRLSLVKKQVLANRFSSEADSSISYAGV